MPKWEYCIERISERSVNIFNDLGARGWELVSVNWSDNLGTAAFDGLGIAVFKRELKEFRPKLEVPPVEEVELTEDGEPAQARAGLEAMKRKFQER